MKNNQLKLLITFLIVFSCTLFFHIISTQAIYKEIKGTTISLSVVDPSGNHTVTLAVNDGTGTTTTVTKAHNATMGSDLYTPTRTDYNFMGWYDSNDRRIYADEQITSDVTFHAEWAKIVCKKVTSVNDLHTEDCDGTQGCTISGVGYTSTDTIRYGSLMDGSIPVAGDAFNCDVYYDPNDVDYDETDTHGKHIERFYFVREKVNNGSENTAVLIYYTSFDGNGRVDTQNTPKADIDSQHYSVAETWLPTSTLWSNPDLIDFDPNNGQITRFLSKADLETVCGSFVNSNSPANAAYFTACFNNMSTNGTVNGKNWFIFENSRFQSSNLARAGMWLETDGTYYYRIQTSTLSVNRFSDGNSSDNITRPVIEVPISALEGYINANRYTITFNTHDGTPTINSVTKYEGDTIGAITTVTRDHYTFDGWYATYNNGVYSDPVDSSTVIHSDLILHAKWVAKPTCTVTLELNGGTGVTTPDIVDIGDLYVPGTPTKTDSTFLGWYTDSATTIPYDSSVPISTATLTLYAKWNTINYVAEVDGVGRYETLAEAFANVPTTGVKTKVTLLQNITISANADCVSVSDTQYIDLDLDGKTITSTNAVTDNLIFVNKGGKLEIANGTVNNAGSKSVVYVDGTGNNKGTLYINPGSVSNGTHLNTTGNYSVISNMGDTYMSGGEITSTSQPAAVNTGTDGNKYNASSNFIMTGGRITTSGSQKNQAIYNNGGARLEISGDVYLYSQSSVSDKLRPTVHNNNGTLIITGGTIVSKNYAAVITNTGSATIGDSTDPLDITTPVLRGKTYGLEGTTAYIYDGIFESETNARAISVTNINPSNIHLYDTTITEGNNTYYATYIITDNTVNFYPENGDSTITKTINSGSPIGSDMPNNPTKSGYYFDGWYDSYDDSLVTSSTVPDRDIDAYARWVQSITNATISSTLSVEKNSTETIVITGTDIEGRTFTSANTNIATVDADGVVTGVNEGSTTVTITGSKSNDTITVTVTVTPEMHDVNFYQSDGGALITTVSVADSGTVGANMPSNPTETNYIFDGWEYVAGSGITPFTSATQILGDVDVYATWTPNINQATIPFTLVVTPGSDRTITVTGPSGMEGYSFVSEDATIASVNSTTGVVHGETYGTVNIRVIGARSGIVKLVEVTVGSVSHQVNFYDEDGQTPLAQSVTVSDGGTVGANMPSNPIKAGYVFEGWIVDDGNSLTPFTSATEVYGDIDAIAVWKEPISTATIASTITIRLGTSQQIVLAPSGSKPVENYTLQSSDSNTVEVNNNTIHGTDIGTVTLTIRGSLSGLTKTITVNVTNKYSVTFKDDNDTVLETIYVDNGDSIDDTEGATLPNNPTKSGYTFDDWYLYDGNDVTTTRLDTSAAVTDDLVYKPRWAGANDVAAIGTTYYSTYKSAVDAVDTDDVQVEIRLLKDISTTGFANNRGLIERGQNILLNGNNHTMTCSGDNAIWNGGTVILKNITVTCGTSKVAPINNGGTLTVIDSTITMTLSGTNGRAAIYNTSYSKDNVTTYGSVTVIGNSTLSTVAKDRSALQNTASGNSINIQGGTISQLAGDATKYAVEVTSGSTATISGGAITAVNNNAVSNTAGTLTITGGTITSQSAYGVNNTGTLTIGTIDSAYDLTSPVIQGETYGINSTVNYSLYDGIIKGKTNSRAVNDFTKITGTESGFERATGIDGAYYTLYYEQPANSKYIINFEGNDGTVSDDYIEYDLNQQITTSDLATATRGVYTFDGWYTDNCSTPFTPFTPNQAGSTTLYACWSYASSTTPVNHIVTGDAMTYYFNNVNTWASADAQIAVNQDQSLDNDDHSTYLSTMLTNFNNYSCSECEINTTRENMNSCNSPSTGTYCDQPKGYDTGIEDDLDVYLYVNNSKSGSKLNGSDPGEYISSDNGVIYNMIPGNTYYWESQSDSNVYGVVTATKDNTNYRRTLKTSIRNLRDLGGMSVSYTVNGVTTTGTIKYGKLYRGAQNATGSTGINELKELGITREVDLRGTGDGNTSQTKFPAANYDVSTSDSLYTRFNNPNTYTTDGYKDVKTTNYIINPTSNTYFQQAHLDNFKDLKQAMKAIMRQIVNHEVVFFHCTIGTDRTGTMAYFLEGLLGASNEDRLRDYEMTYFFGLTNRSRFHNNLSTSNINPRFYAMYKSYPDVSDIEDFYLNNYSESDDASLLAAFRAEMIE